MDFSSFLTPEVLNNRYELYAQMRQSQPIMHLPDFHLWLAFRYDDVKAILGDYATFSSDFGKSAEEFAAGSVTQTMREQMDKTISASLITTDPPLHRKLRELVTRAFTPKAVENLEPR